jgi:hypothetical protein
MAASPLTKKLLIKPNYSVAILNAPEGYVDSLGELPDGVKVADTVVGAHDLVQVFVYSLTDLEARFDTAQRAVKNGGLLWVTYPKKTGTIKTDIHRDNGNAYAATQGWEGVAMIAIDDTWSAMRFKPK